MFLKSVTVAHFLRIGNGTKPVQDMGIYRRKLAEAGQKGHEHEGFSIWFRRGNRHIE